MLKNINRTEGDVSALGPSSASMLTTAFFCLPQLEEGLTDRIFPSSQSAFPCAF